MTSGLQPFLISEFKTGLFQYQEPWIRPIDAFEPCINAYVYRGSLNKRQGYSVYGYMTYEDNGIAVGNGGKTYSGTLAVHPIIPGTFDPTDGIESFTDNGMGVLTGSAGGTGTIDYTSGAWTLVFNATVASGVLIDVIYQPNARNPIMGLKTWSSEVDGTVKLVAFDTRRAAVYNDSTNSFTPLSSVDQIIWVGDGATTTINLGTGWVAVAPYTSGLAPYSISITDGTSTITDNGSGGLTASGNFAAGGTVNYSTGVIHLVFTTAPATTVTITLTALLSGDYFTGNTSNFFNATNWLGLMFAVNNKDPITTFDGANLARPPFPITLANKTAYINNIGTCLDIDVYKNRLLIQRPTIINDGSGNGLFPQSIRWSAQFNPTNLVADVTGNGGELSAPTDDFMQTSEFLRDQLVVMFGHSTWLFRFTGSDFDPFRWDKINNTKSTAAPYGTIPYDERITAMGPRGLIACDGVNVDRYDIPIIDQFLQINQNYFAQCYGLRFDTTNQSWMLYPSEGPNATLSDSALIYNFIENTWSVYSLSLSCLGVYHTTKDQTWDDFAPGTPLGTEFPNWNSAEFPWDNYLIQDLSLALLGGGFNGIVYEMNNGTTDNGVAIESSVTSTRWNPFVGTGKKVQFAHIDFYYAIDPDLPPAVIDLTFYTSNSSSTATTRTLTLDGDEFSDYAWKRIYINNIGEFLRMNMDCKTNSNFKIVGMILWAKESGRLTP